MQRAVTASFPESLRHRLQAELLLDSQDLVSERPAAPEVLTWVLGLWTERLVGGEPEQPDDQPVIVALTRLSPRTGYRLCRLAGLAKLAMTGQTPGNRASGPLQRGRRVWPGDPLAAVEPEFLAAVRGDVEGVISVKVPRRLMAARLGLVTFARLLGECEPFRLRWALQHWPYPIAKLARSLIPTASGRSPFLFHGESLVLKTAWDRLTLEGQLPLSWPDRGSEQERSHLS